MTNRSTTITVLNDHPNMPVVRVETLDAPDFTFRIDDADQLEQLVADLVKSSLYQTWKRP